MLDIGKSILNSAPIFVEFITLLLLAFSGVRVTRFLVLCVMLCRSLFVPLCFFFWQLCCLFFFDIGILVSSNSSIFF
jgi:hypothetical protein